MGAVNFGVGEGVIGSDGSLVRLELKLLLNVLFLLMDFSVKVFGDMKDLSMVSTFVDVAGTELG